ncbi:Gtr1/RagA G protein conserved region-domain-containing protein [Mycena rebaudengoi]|nr:Gtr1/RagA G protein conserved region-domain-containing protein [Mycena rebaudengoi]
MGASGSGKTSMRSLIFSNNPASLTARLGATIDVEAEPYAFMDSYLTTQRSTIFQQVGVLIYVFDVETNEMNKDLEYYRDCLDGLRQFSPDAAVFLLVHKMDLRKKKELQEQSEKGTAAGPYNIYDESLYRAWSSIVHTLIPNAAVLTKHLTIFAEACSATEVILFERTTFLPSSDADSGSRGQLEATRYERTSELIKAFKHSCSRLPEFSAVLDEMTKNTYVLIIVHDPTIETAALKLNIRMARRKFEELQGLT